MGIFCLHLFLFRFLQVRKMPPRKRRQWAGAMNYLKRKDVKEGVRGDGGLRAAEERVEGSVGHGLETEERVVVEEMEVRDDGGSGTLEERVEERQEVRDDGGSGTLEERVEERQEVRDDGGSGTLEERVEEREEVRNDGGSGTLEEDREEVRDDGGSRTLEERDKAECGPSSEEAPATKRRRLSAIARMGDESLQGWLDDLQQMALLLYTRLPAIFGLKKTDTAAALSEVLQKNERTVRRWVDDFASNRGEFSESQQGHYARMTLMSNEEICERARVYV